MEEIASQSDVSQSSSKHSTDPFIDSDGYSLLHFACFNGHSTCTETLLELSENYPFLTEMFTEDNHTHNKFSPLHFACYNSHDSCLNQLLEAFADKVERLLNLEDENGNTSIHICAVKNEYDCALLLLENGSPYNKPNKNGHTPFMLAAGHNALNILELLTKFEPSKLNSILNMTDKKENTALHLALLNENIDCVKFILDRIQSGSKLINWKNIQGETPLHIAASKGYSSIVNSLISKGADILAKNQRHQTPLIRCAKNDQVANCLEILLEKFVALITDKSIVNSSIGQLLPVADPVQLLTKVANLNLNNFTQTQNVNIVSDNILNNSTYTLNTSSDVVINDVNIHDLNNNDNIDNATFECNPENINLNSTLIINEPGVFNNLASDKSFESLNADDFETSNFLSRNNRQSSKQNLFVKLHSDEFIDHNFERENNENANINHELPIIQTVLLQDSDNFADKINPCPFISSSLDADFF